MAMALKGIPIGLDGLDGLVDEIDQSQYKVKALLKHKADVEVVSPTVLLTYGHYTKGAQLINHTLALTCAK
jgi:hypothetical protein